MTLTTQPTSTLVRPQRPALRSLVTGRTFVIAILAATFCPLAAAAVTHVIPASTRLGFGTLFTILSTVAGTHVFSTAYLLFDPREHAGVVRPTITLVAVPAVLLAANFFALLAAPLWLTMMFMLVYIHYGMWHFGRQNLGVLAFVARLSLKRPMSRFERRTIMAGVFAGMCAAYTIFAPALLLIPKAFPFDVSSVDEFFRVGWYVGAAIEAVLVPVVLLHVANHRDAYEPYTLATYLAGVFFFLPVFVSSDPLLSLATWMTAHGLQYLVFLSFHAAGKSRPVIPTLFLVGMAAAGYAIWQFSARLQSVDDMVTIKLAVSVVTGLTLVHYWVDQFLWKFNSVERRAWLARNYAFLMD
jgi:hypothetical protein